MKKNIKEVAEFVDGLARDLKTISNKNPDLNVDLNVELRKTGIAEVMNPTRLKVTKNEWTFFEDLGGREYSMQISIPNYIPSQSLIEK